MSAYVTIGKPSFLSSGGLAPPRMEGKPPGSVVSHIAIIRQGPLVWQQNYVLFQIRAFPSLLNGSFTKSPPSLMCAGKSLLSRPPTGLQGKY